MANELVHGTVGTTLTQAEYEAVGAHVFNSGAIGDIPYASSATQLSRLAIGAANQVLQVSGGVPVWTSEVASLTLNNAVGKGTWTASGTWTIPAVTLGGDISAAGRNVNNASTLQFRSLEGVLGTDIIRPKAADDAYIQILARDNGVGNVEVARIQGAADPYFQATLAFRLNPIATASLPAAPVEGMLVYDDTANKLKVYNGAAWETVTSA